MKNAIAVWALAGLSMTVVAQEAPPELMAIEGVAVNKIEMTQVPQPTSVAYLRSKPARALDFKEWVLVEAEFTINPRDAEHADKDFVNEVELKFYLLTPEVDGEDRVTLACPVKFGPVKKGTTKLYMGALMPPNFALRYGGANQIMSSGNAAVVLAIGGKDVAEKEFRATDKRGEEGWYLKGGGARGALRPYTLTPFAGDYAERYYPLNEPGM